MLLAAGLIAGEALIGLLFAGLAVGNLKYGEWLTRTVGFLPLNFGWQPAGLRVHRLAAGPDPARERRHVPTSRRRRAR